MRLSLLVLLLTGCTARLAPAGSPERCARLDDRRIVAGAVWKGSAAASVGLATPALVDNDSDPNFRKGLALGAVTAAVVTAGAAYLQEGTAESYSRDCQ